MASFGETSGSLLSSGEPLALNYAPQLSPLYSGQFYQVAANIAFISLERQIERLNQAVERAEVVKKAAQVDGRHEAYNGWGRNIAALLLLRDLLQMGWKMRLSGPRIQLVQGNGEQGDVQQEKEQIRQSMDFERRESLLSPAVQGFMRYMERPRIVDGNPRSVLSLMANGERLAASLQAIRALEDAEQRVKRLRRLVKPYLELVDAEKRDDYTGLRLMDIWRYFRLTWSTPYRSTPGRNLFYLVRDAGQPCHPVIGIAGLGNCVIGLKCRDDRIGWTPDALAERLKEAHRQGGDALEAAVGEIAGLLRKHLEAGLAAVDISGITTANAVLNPSEETVAAIEQVAQEAAEERYRHLRREAIQEIAQEDEEFALVPPPAPLIGDDAILSPAYRAERDSARELFRRKRAAKLASLLRAKLLFRRLGLGERPAHAVPALLWTDADWTIKFDKGRSALRAVLNANKGTKIGSAMMEIIVCGAVAPYSHLLGGKLAALLLASPEVGRDYAARYGEMASTIASRVAGHEVTRSAALVYLGTSSLYAGGGDKKRMREGDSFSGEAPRKRPSSASQYNRVAVPGSIAKRPGQIRYECIGVTEGYGVVHFSSDTRVALEELDRILHQAKRVNSLFGEGTSPRLRKIRQGISLLGLDDRFLVHGQSRLVYAVPLAHNTHRYLNGLDDTPEYILPQNNPKRTTDRIAAFWIERWLSSRLNHAPALEAVGAFVPEQGAVSRQYQAEANVPTALILPDQPDEAT